jgi:hypothetical protein
MHNFYTIEVEAELRRQEWERAAAADARAGLAARAARAVRRLRSPQAALAQLRALPAPRAAITASYASCGPWPVTS